MCKVSAEVSIDVSAEDGDFMIENAEMTFIRIAGCGLSLEVSWEQAERIYSGLRDFFEEPTP
jgi:hypothetical protein